MDSVAEKQAKNQKFAAALAERGEFRRLREEIARGTRVLCLSGLTSPASKAFILAALQKDTRKTLAVATATNQSLETLAGDLDFFVDEKTTLLELPAMETDVYSGVSPHSETLEQRALALWQMAQGRGDIVLASARSLITKVPTKTEIVQMGEHLKIDEDHPPETLAKKLMISGYTREEPLAGVGQFSVRGGILDVWPPDADSPLRIEFFGDTVDSIREFDVETQLSTGQLKEVSLPPMREFAAAAQDFRDWAFFAREKFTDEAHERALRDRAVFADEGEPFNGWEWLYPLLHPRSASVFDYLKDCVLVIDEPVEVEQTLAEFYDALAARFLAVQSAGELGLPPDELFLTAEELRENLGKFPRLELRALGRAAAATDEEIALSGSLEKKPLFLFPTAEKATNLEIQSRGTRKYYGKIADLAADLKSNALLPNFIFHASGMAERFAEILREYDLSISPEAITVGHLSSGFEIAAATSLLTETDIFGETSEVQSSRFKVQGGRGKRSKTAAFVSDFRDLKPGDYVVHIDHGIGRFEGLEMIGFDGQQREFMLLIYADNAKLFVPVERLDLVSRYSSAEATQPALDRLGGLGWQKTKAKAKRAMRDMADELLRLYAERKLVTGFAYSADSPWQREFEDAFPYDLTPDQAAAIEEVKKDMEIAEPMDRLLCGDVGYGKTEVAMRAAFKAVMDGKQVAVLTPTTVLAYQHFETFKQRFAAFPAKIELLSRFRSVKEQKAVVAETEKGAVDVLVGTHRMLSNDVTLPKLGLVVVDEEQRFGVAHKEKLKKLKKRVDVLTLSATPIPRTLNMSLMGMRDMSVIETPPRDRLAINTQVAQFSEGVIKTAIELEMARQGQVFFIHNRVETITSVAMLIQKIVPHARIIVAHGQMNEKAMEQAVLDFVAYKHDVLVATTIVENGIDIPRANTMIINRADNYGLSQLYQLRGRVGRSNRRAYAYLLIPSELELTPIARRRLSAIREFSDLGAGFRIAALDLELRGAGNLLGGQQSGHLDALGFDLYTKMLERTVAELRGETVEDEVSVSLNLGIDVAIPSEYISETGQRLRTYKRVSSAEGDDELRQIHAEIEDRYGKLPESVENLFDYARLRKQAEGLGAVSVDKTQNGFAIKLSENAKVSPESLLGFVGARDGASFSPNGILRVEVKDPRDLLATIRQTIEQISS
jgi:transcription-repair coupling factor (superfamily II helicase)